MTRLLLAAAAACVATPALAAAPALYPGSTYRYAADLSGPSPAAHVALALVAGLDGRIGGTIVATDRAGRIVARGPVTGRIDGQDCTLRMTVAAVGQRRPGQVTDVMGGSCTAAMVQGGVRVERPERGLAAFFDWWGGGQGTGQFWMVANPA